MESIFILFLTVKDLSLDNWFLIAESDESEKDESVKAQTSEEQLSSVEKKMESKAEVLHIERMDLDKGTKKSYNETEPLLSASVDRREYFNPKKGKIFCPENGVWYDTLFPRKGDVRLEGKYFASLPLVKYPLFLCIDSPSLLCLWALRGCMWWHINGR